MFSRKETKKSGNKIPKYVRKMMRKRKKITKRIKQTKDLRKLVQLTNDLRNIESSIQNNINKKKCKEEEKVVQNMKDNPKFFFKFAKDHSKMNDNIGPLMDKNGDIHHSNKKIAKYFVNSTSLCFQ